MSTTTNSISDTTTKSVRAASRKSRVFVFRDFLWETYGNPNEMNDDDTCSTPYLRSGDVILDVAGGKGDLSWLFLNVDGISSVVVDPRSMSSTNHLIRSVNWLQDHPEEARQRAVPNLSTHQPLAALIPQIMERKARRRHDSQKNKKNGLDSEYLNPRHLRIKLNNDLVENLRKAIDEQQQVSEESLEAGCPVSWTVFWDQLRMQENTTNPLVSADACFLPASERKDDGFIETINDASEAWTVFRSIRLIVGFHPDQATEPCLDLAEVLRIPLCIVPCCVFPSEFPDRKVAVQEDNGKVTLTRVRDYQLFLQYLQHKQPKLRNAKIPFHYTGTPLKNIALFTLPEDSQ